ncbi:MAG: PAS domain-containing sensor histidine kinase [Gemmatimonadota bacterium]
MDSALRAEGREQREEEAYLSELDGRVLFEICPDGCLVFDSSGSVLLANQRAEEMFGYGRRRMMGVSLEAIVPEYLRESHQKALLSFVNEPGRQPIRKEFEARRLDGSDFPVFVGLAPIANELDVHVLAVVHDLTPKKRLQRFGSGVLRGMEEERERVARDLHDDTAQRLSALIMRVQMIRKAEGPERREELLKGLYEELQEADAAVRRIVHGLRPPELDASGVIAAVRAHVRRATADLDLETEIIAGPMDPQALAPAPKLALYRIIQEAVTNVIRHSRATRMEIVFSQDHEAVMATVSDNGRGFSLHARSADAGRGLGWFGMRERAALAGGEVNLASAPGAGAEVRVRIPVADREEEM